MQAAVSEVFTSCNATTCATHVERKFNDGAIGKRLKKAANIGGCQSCFTLFKKKSMSKPKKAKSREKVGKN